MRERMGGQKDSIGNQKIDDSWVFLRGGAKEIA